MMYVFGLVALVLAAGMVVLFAMLGELSARVGPGSAPQVESSVWVLTDVALGGVPSALPAGLSGLNGLDRLDRRGPSMLLVLSTQCRTCTSVGEQLRDNPDLADPATIGVVVTTGEASQGAAFIQRYNLGSIPNHIDLDGAWMRTQFGVNFSPTALVFRDGVLVSALGFTSVPALRAAVLDAAERVITGDEPVAARG
ncbi:hypothetical protein [Dactylosporangium salmoneum]